MSNTWVTQIVSNLITWPQFQFALDLCHVLIQFCFNSSFDRGKQQENE